MKEEEGTGSDSRSEPDDVPASVTGDITDVAGYEKAFRPRRRELTRTPPFEAPPDGASDVEVTNSIKTNLRITKNGRVSITI